MAEEEATPTLTEKISKGWKEARTIIIGALVFVAAFTWRDFMQQVLKKIELRFQKFPRLLFMFLLASIMTTICVWIIIATDHKAPTRLMQMI